MSLNWKSIPLPIKEAHIATILRCGQSFRWKQINNVWSLAYKGRVIFLKQEDDVLYYSSLYPDSNGIKREDGVNDIKKEEQPTHKLNNSHISTIDLINDYFNLNINLSSLYSDWASRDTQFNKISDNFPGIRILRQDPWENICSFICSTNNNIKRISRMVDNLCINFGTYITTYDGIEYYDFPNPNQLSPQSVETKLRSLGFGYRAKYIQKTAEMVSTPDKGIDFLLNLRNLSYQDAHQQLIQFSGVGPKVADCVCLMSLDKHDVVPVDTHVWQIAQRDYKFGRKFKSLNKTSYDEIRNFFANLWGPYAGWAHSVLFTADLRDLNNGVNKVDQPPLDLSPISKKRIKAELVISPKRPRTNIVKA